MSADGAPAALLVDADNVTAAAVEHAIERLSRETRVTVRRAYGGHEKLAGMKDCLLRHGFRAMVNQGKGTTDALLVLDAMDLLHAGALPSRVAIASSDADFAPLALRLRESGRHVICFAHAGKSADAELARCYDELVYVDAVPADPAPAPSSAKAGRKAPARKKAQAPAARGAAPAATPDPVRDVLAGIEGFAQGHWIELNEAVKRLRDAKLLGKSASGPKFLAKNAGYVEMAPGAQPNRLRLASPR
jgi:hypothetical protein